MISVYGHVQRIANEMITDAYSNRVVTPDVTTTNDLNWWIRHKYLGLDLETENHPTITVQRSDENLARYNDPPDVPPSVPAGWIHVRPQNICGWWAIQMSSRRIQECFQRPATEKEVW